MMQSFATPEYSDASPKGSVDAPIREFIDEINRVPGYVTTSSCSGRLSVFLEGRKAESSQNEISAPQPAGVGGKGGGGTWLFISHDPISNASDTSRDWTNELGLTRSETSLANSQSQRLIHFKFEPMILHVLTASPTHAQALLKCAMQAGFRESGALNLLSASTSDQTKNDASPTPMVAIRTMGLAFESLIGAEIEVDGAEAGQRLCTVSEEYLRTLMRIADERFVENTKRISRLRTAFFDAVKEPQVKKNPDGQPWEDAATRRERLRAEGLRRRELLRAAAERESVPDKYDEEKVIYGTTLDNT